MRLSQVAGRLLAAPLLLVHTAAALPVAPRWGLAATRSDSLAALRGVGFAEVLAVGLA